MSRVRILGLPASVTKSELQQFVVGATMGSSGTTAKPTNVKASTLCITDCTILRTSSGVVRMAFIGLKTTGGAALVVQQLNGAYFGSRKLTVEIAKSVAETNAEKQQNLQRIAADEQNQKRSNSHEKASVAASRTSKRDTFVGQQLDSKPMWASEVLVPPTSGIAAPTTTVHEDSSLVNDEAEALRKQQELEFVSDLDFLKSVATDNAKGSAKPTQASGPIDKKCGIDVKESANEVLVAEDDDTAPFLRTRIVNIPFLATEDEVRNLVSTQVGHVAEVHIPLTRDTKQSKGCAFVKFTTEADAKKCLALSGTTFMGRVISVQRAAEDPYGKPSVAPTNSGVPPTDGVNTAPTRRRSEDHTSAFKRQRDGARKSNENPAQWNPLYMDSATAVANMAQRLHVTPHDIVNPDSSGAAVRAAVAETVLTNEARNILSDDGIDFSVLEHGKSVIHTNRSNVTILVKGLRAGCDVAKIVQLFRKYGMLETVAMPSDPTFVVVSFVHSQDAKVAFQRLGFRRISGAPLLLEWAPIGCLKDNSTTAADETQPRENALLRPDLTVEDDDNLKTKIAAFTVYITNLPFGASRDSVEEFLFDCCPRFASNQSLVKRIDVHSDAGRAFVTLADEPSFGYALAKLKDRTIDGRVITAVPSKSTSSGSAVAAKKAAPTAGASTSVVPAGANPCKIVVKNLPFEATEADLRQLFASFCEVKAVRVPKKLHNFSAHRSNNHRGFGFVEFFTEKEAARALVALSSTHLYGRHLVLEHAKQVSTADDA